MAENKTKPAKLSVAGFIDGLTDPARRADAKALVKVTQSAAGEKPKMWGPSIIGFGRYHYKYESGREGDMPVIAFSPRKSAWGKCGRYGVRLVVRSPRTPFLDNFRIADDSGVIATRCVAP